MGSNNNELALKIVKMEECSNQTKSRLDKLEKTIEVIYSLASDIKSLATELKNLREDVNEIKQRQDRRDNEPNTMLSNIKTAIIGGTCMVIISLIINTVLK